MNSFGIISEDSIQYKEKEGEEFDLDQLESKSKNHDMTIGSYKDKTRINIALRFVGTIRSGSC